MSLVRFPNGSTKWEGERGKARFLVGDLEAAVLQWLRDDPFWDVVADLSWTATGGTVSKDPRVRKRMKAEVASKKRAWASDSGRNSVKIQLAGRCGETDRKMLNGLSCDTELEAKRCVYWMEACRRANRAGLEQFNVEFRRQLLRVPAGERSTNGDALLEFEAGDVQTHPIRQGTQGPKFNASLKARSSFQLVDAPGRNEDDEP